MKLNLSAEEAVVKCLSVMMENWDRCDDEEQSTAIADQIFEVAEVFRPQILKHCNNNIRKVYDSAFNGPREVLVTYKNSDWHIESHRYSD